MKKYLLVLAVFVASIGFMTVPVAAHPGSTDANGGHYCRTNCAKWGYSTGSYHSHGAAKASAKSSAKSTVKKITKSSAKKSTRR